MLDAGHERIGHETVPAAVEAAAFRRQRQPWSGIGAEAEPGTQAPFFRGFCFDQNRNMEVLRGLALDVHFDARKKTTIFVRWG